MPGTFGFLCAMYGVNAVTPFSCPLYHHVETEEGSVRGEPK
jgi:hypothetical protein